MHLNTNKDIYYFRPWKPVRPIPVRSLQFQKIRKRTDTLISWHVSIKSNLLSSNRPEKCDSIEYGQSLHWEK